MAPSAPPSCCSPAPAAAVPEAALGPGISGRLPVPASGSGGLSHLEVSPEPWGWGQKSVVLLIPFLPLSPKSFEEGSSLRSPQASKSLLCPLQCGASPSESQFVLLPLSFAGTYSCWREGWGGGRTRMPHCAGLSCSGQLGRAGSNREGSVTESALAHAERRVLVSGMWQRTQQRWPLRKILSRYPLNTCEHVEVSRCPSGI